MEILPRISESCIAKNEFYCFLTLILITYDLQGREAVLDVGILILGTSNLGVQIT